MFDDNQLILFELLEGKDDRLPAHIKLEGKFFLYQPLPFL